MDSTCNISNKDNNEKTELQEEEGQGQFSVSFPIMINLNNQHNQHFIAA